MHTVSLSNATMPAQIARIISRVKKTVALLACAVTLGATALAQLEDSARKQNRRNLRHEGQLDSRRAEDVHQPGARVTKGAASVAGRHGALPRRSPAGRLWEN